MLVLAGCPRPFSGHHQGSNNQQSRQADEPASAAGGSRTAAAYDDTVRLLAGADDETADTPTPLPGHKASARLIVRIRLYAAAEKRAGDMLATVKQMKAGGHWHDGLKYAVTGKEVLTESEILHRLDEMRERGKAGREDLAPKLAAAYRHEFPKISSAQLEALDKYGLPIEIKSGKRRGESCWKFETEDAWPIACWKKSGALASATTKPKPAAATVDASAAPEGGEAKPKHSGGDCRGIVDHNSAECDTGDCRGVVDHNSAECDTGSCRGLVDHNSAECEDGDCRGIADHNSAECETGDCRGIVDHNSAECETGFCRGIVDHNSAECE